MEMIVRTLSVVGGALVEPTSRGRGLEEEDLPPILGCIQTVLYSRWKFSLYIRILSSRSMASAISELYPAGCVVWYKLPGWPWWPSKVLVLEPHTHD